MSAGEVVPWVLLGGAAFVVVKVWPTVTSAITNANTAVAQINNQAAQLSQLEQLVYPAPGSQLPTTKVCNGTTYVQNSGGSWSIQCPPGQACSQVATMTAPC